MLLLAAANERDYNYDDQVGGRVLISNTIMCLSSSLQIANPTSVLRARLLLAHFRDHDKLHV